MGARLQGRSAQIVTSDEVIVVDADDHPRGRCDKLNAHRAPGVLHRALSVMLWVPGGGMLLQRRAEDKYPFAGLWSNSCCTHPRPGESVLDAAARRIEEELGAKPSALHAVGRFVYLARDDFTGMVEREVDHVLAGRIDGELRPDPAEIADLVTVDAAALDRWLADDPSAFSPWFAEAARLAVVAAAFWRDMT